MYSGSVELFVLRQTEAGRPRYITSVYRDSQQRLVRLPCLPEAAQHRHICYLWYYPVLGRPWLVPDILQLTQHYKTKAMKSRRCGYSMVM